MNDPFGHVVIIQNIHLLKFIGEYLSMCVYESNYIGKCLNIITVIRMLCIRLSVDACVKTTEQVIVTEGFSPFALF